MKEFLKLMLVPTAICVACAALLAYVYGVTKAPIAEGAAKRELAAAAELLGSGSAEKVSTPDGAVSGFIVRDAASGAVSGLAVQGFSEHGYGGNLRILAAFGPDGRVLEYKVLDISETPGLGSKIDKDFMHERVREAPHPANWNVTKDGGDIEAVTAATISSRALMEALRDAQSNRETLLSSL